MAITPSSTHESPHREQNAPPAASGWSLARQALHLADAEPTSGSTSWVRNWASQDWLTVTYLMVVIAALGVGHGPNRNACLVRVAADLGVFLLVLALVRGVPQGPGSTAGSLLYRTTFVGVLLSSYLQLSHILPAVSPWSVDARIYTLDLRLFGFEPSLYLDRFVTPMTTEWFAFFYFLYFLILSVHILPMAYWSRDTLLVGRFATGTLLMFFSAHLLYMLVPGYGPYWYLRSSFHHELAGGPFWRLVQETVDAGGAQKDIFPSLHTAAPTYLAIFSFRHRDRAPFKYSWPVVAFLATQIIIATMFLRWHYLIDIVAGLTLATTASLLGQRIADWEHAKRERLGLQPVWFPIPRGSGG
jgi:hypothetical protein